LGRCGGRHTHWSWDLLFRQASEHVDRIRAGDGGALTCIRFREKAVQKWANLFGLIAIVSIVGRLMILQLVPQIKERIACKRAVEMISREKLPSSSVSLATLVSEQRTERISFGFLGDDGRRWAAGCSISPEGLVTATATPIF
jgi:hypothetical protein